MGSNGKSRSLATAESPEHTGTTRTGTTAGRRERPVPAESYYGQPILNPPTWAALDIAGYLFLGGLAGASATLGAGADRSGRPDLARAAKTAAAGAAGLSLVALVHDLGRPARFVNMLRVLKPTSPMSVGSWLLAGFAPATFASAGSSWTGLAPKTGRTATVAAALLGPAVASYTAVLISDTAVPAWHEGHRELPFVFAGSAAAAAGGLGLAAAPLRQSAPARRAAVAGAAVELVGTRVMRRRMGMASDAFDEPRPRRLMHAAELLTALGAVAAAAGHRSRLASAAGGAALLAGSAATRLGIFHAGVASAEDPAYTVRPQRERLEARRAADQPTTTE